ncbi:hypothetical protein [Tengunoibacter tsumagoiensis]|uniref:Uncharacterized protein n=1 Tax=Tengunoibacter tsumagoiensis TaxID=2014871 RepID=A0A402A6Q9_9CHLR|nr:hypothetical protein [Tengunoibacter tsumagoiensis]GCE14827.1 hypothetical protein KTT_46860 [Tengunoibacter tsumagoiensis]
MQISQTENKGRILTIEHPTESTPALMVFSGNAGQLLRGDQPTLHVLKAMRQRTIRNGVPFTIHLQEAGAMNKKSVGMTRLLEDVFGDEVVIFRYGSAETDGQVRDGLDQYLVSSRQLQIRARNSIHLPMVDRKLMRRNQRVALNTSFDLPLPNGETGYVVTTGFHYDLGLTANSTRISRLQAVETRLGVEQLIQQDLQYPGSDPHNPPPPPQHLQGLVVFSGDGNTRGGIGTRWQMDRVEALKKGLGENVMEATAEINVTANLPHSIQQEFLEKEHPIMKFAGTIVNTAIDALDATTGNKWGERKLDHQFYRDFTINADGLFVPLHRFDVIENTVFYNFANADHYVVSTLFGYQKP